MYTSRKALYLIRHIICLLVEVKQASVLTHPSSKSNSLLRLCFQSNADPSPKLCHHTGECLSHGCKLPESCDSLWNLSGSLPGGGSIIQWRVNSRVASGRVIKKQTQDLMDGSYAHPSLPPQCMANWCMTDYGKLLNLTKSLFPHLSSGHLCLPSFL